MKCTTGFLLSAASFLALGEIAQADVIDFSAPPYSASGDGTTDNRPALSRALKALREGDTLMFPAGDYLFALDEGQLRIPSGVTLQGQQGKTNLLLSSAEGMVRHREFLRFSSGVTLEGLTIERTADFPMVMFPLFGELNDLTVRNCTIVGHKTKFPEKYCHAFQVGVGSVENVLFSRIEIRNCSFGLFQANDATGSLKSMRVEHSRFAENTASDLEFNAPRGTMRDITVSQCHFQDNLCQSPSAGFAVGFANVQNAKVEDCYIQNYGSEALHVEDRSENIELVGNAIFGGSLLQKNGIILVINQSKNIEVRDNFIDARANDNKTNLILVTAGGETFQNPTEVSVTENILVNGPATRTWYLQPGSGPPPSGNTVMKAKVDPREPGD